MSHFEQERKKQQIQGTNAAMNIVRNIQERVPPSNEEIIKVLDSTEAALDESKKHPSADEKGKNLIRDSEALIDATRNIIEKKNKDEKIQKLILETKAATAETDVSLDNLESLGKEELEKIEQLRHKMNETAKHGRVAAEHLLRSSEFRNLISDGLDFLKSIYFQIEEKVDSDIVDQPLGAVKESVDVVLNEEIEIPEEDKRLLYKRFKQLLNRISTSDEHQKAVDSLFQLIDLIEIEGEKLEERTEQSVKIHLDEHARNATNNLKLLIEEFTGGKTLDNLFREIKELIILIKNDKELNDCFKCLKDNFTKALKDPSILDDDDFRTTVEDKFKEGRNIIKNEEYKKKSNIIINEWEEITNNLKEDVELNTFNLAFKRLVSDVTVSDSEGNVKFDFDALDQIRTLLVPILIEQIKYIPLNTIEGSTDTYDYKLENIVLSGYDIFPHHINIKTDSNVDVSIRDDEPSRAKGRFVIVVDNIKTQMKGIKFQYKRKSFPEISDQGIADVDIGGDGLQIKITMNVTGTGSNMRFVDAEIWTYIDKLDIQVNDSSHNILYKLFKGTFSNIVKSMIEKQVGDSLAVAVSKFRKEMNDLLEKVTPERFVESLSNRFSGISLFT